jgi:hypothetical protein
MRKLLIYILSVFITSTSFGQKDIAILRIDDLVKICKMSSNDIEVYASKRNLEIESLGETDDTFIEDVKFRHTEISEYKFRYTKTKTGCGIFTIGFDHQKLFNNQKLKAVELGFKLFSTETYKHPTKTDINVKEIKYKKANMVLTFYNFIDKDKYSGLPYEITLSYKCD